MWHSPWRPPNTRGFSVRVWGFRVTPTPTPRAHRIFRTFRSEGSTGASSRSTACMRRTCGCVRRVRVSARACECAGGWGRLRARVCVWGGGGERGERVAGTREQAPGEYACKTGQGSGEGGSGRKARSHIHGCPRGRARGAGPCMHAHLAADDEARRHLFKGLGAAIRQQLVDAVPPLKGVLVSCGTGRYKASVRGWFAGPAGHPHGWARPTQGRRVGYQVQHAGSCLRCRAAPGRPRT